MLKSETFFAVWQPGSGGQRWHHDLDATELKSLHKTYAGKGMHLAALDIWRSSPVPPRRSYIGVWRAGAAKQYLEPLLSIAEFKTMDDAHVAKGRRVAVFDIDDTGQICVAWQAGSGPQPWCASYSGVDFKDLATKQHKLGYRLMVMRQHGADDFAGVWNPGSGAQWFHTGMSEAECIGADTAYFNTGLRLNSLDEYRGTLNAVWGPGKGAQHVRWNRSFAEIKDLDDGYFAEGMRLKVLKRAGVGKGSAHK